MNQYGILISLHPRRCAHRTVALETTTPRVRQNFYSFSREGKPFPWLAIGLALTRWDMDLTVGNVHIPIPLTVALLSPPLPPERRKIC